MSHVDIRFTDKNSERFMLARRVYKVIEDLENEYLYPDSETLGGFKFRDGQYKFSQIDEGEWTDFDSENDYWGYKEDYAWFRHSFTVPERFAGRPVVYQLTPSASGPWNRSNPKNSTAASTRIRTHGNSRASSEWARASRSSMTLSTASSSISKPRSKSRPFMTRTIFRASI